MTLARDLVRWQCSRGLFFSFLFPFRRRDVYDVVDMHTSDLSLINERATSVREARPAELAPSLVVLRASFYGAVPGPGLTWWLDA
jgi:hypothetical protein